MTKTTPKNPFILAYARYVAAGVKLLNKKVPGWTKPNKLSLTDLDLQNRYSCVLGQLAAKSAITGAGFTLTDEHDYFDAEGAMKINGDDYGFNVRYLGLSDDESDTEGYFALNHLWAEAIRMVRRGEKVTVASLKEIA